MPHPPLTDTHRLILDLESNWYLYEGRKQHVIYERLGISAARFYQVRDWLIDQPAAAEYAPSTVARLRRLRDQRREARSA